MPGTLGIPNYLTHYYWNHPFCSLTELSAVERARVVEGLDVPKEAAHRLRSSFYFEERIRYEAVMYEQFVAKGGRPARRHPWYAVLGEPEIWAGICSRATRIPISKVEDGIGDWSAAAMRRVCFRSAFSAGERLIKQ